MTFFKIIFTGHRITLSFISSLLVLVGACATRNTVSNPPDTGDDLVEARGRVADALNATQSMLDALETLNDVSPPYPPVLLTQFATNVTRLQVDSLKLRACTRAMRSRGDAYFQQWQTHFANAPDPLVRQLAREHRQSLQRSFDTIHAGSEQTGRTFQSFILDVQTLRRALEGEPSDNASNITKQLIRKARDDGQKLRENLGAIRHEWESVTSNLLPTKESAQW